jgi:hypothetical protein
VSPATIAQLRDLHHIPVINDFHVRVAGNGADYIAERREIPACRNTTPERDTRSYVQMQKFLQGLEHFKADARMTTESGGEFMRCCAPSEELTGREN